MIKIVPTRHLYPSIADRSWGAYFGGEIPPVYIGYGATKEDAVADLKRLEREHWGTDHEEASS